MIWSRSLIISIIDEELLSKYPFLVKVQDKSFAVRNSFLPRICTVTALTKDQILNIFVNPEYHNSNGISLFIMNADPSKIHVMLIDFAPGLSVLR